MPGEPARVLPSGIDPLEGEADPDPLELLEGASFQRKGPRPVGETSERLAGEQSVAQRFVVGKDDRTQVGEEVEVILLLGNAREDLLDRLAERGAEVTDDQDRDSEPIAEGAE